MDGIKEINYNNVSNFNLLSNYSGLSNNFSSYVLNNDKVWIFEQTCMFFCK